MLPRRPKYDTFVISILKYYKISNILHNNYIIMFSASQLSSCLQIKIKNAIILLLKGEMYDRDLRTGIE